MTRVSSFWNLSWTSAAVSTTSWWFSFWGRTPAAMAAKEDISYLSVIICFVMFLANDLYGFVSWKRMEKRQMAVA